MDWFYLKCRKYSIFGGSNKKHQLVKAILNNWRALAIFFGENDDANSKGFESFLIDADNLRKISFCADLLNAFQRFQKQLQSDSLTLPMFCQSVQRFINVLTDLKTRPILGGSESQIANQMMWEDDEKLYMNGIELLTEYRGRNQPPELSVFKAAVIDRLTHNLKVRLQDEDGDLLFLVESFFKFEKELDITEIHSTFAKDLSLSELHLQYIDFANSYASVKNQSLPQLLKYFTDSKRSEQFSELTTVLARILACTPHSAD